EHVAGPAGGRLRLRLAGAAVARNRGADLPAAAAVLAAALRPAFGPALGVLAVLAPGGVAGLLGGLPGLDLVLVLLVPDEAEPPAADQQDEQERQNDRADREPPAAPLGPARPGRVRLAGRPRRRPDPPGRPD